jgi:NAD(P)-dependent dehydrogenase (short-subunit alcohol dehydrogenase family)
MLQASPDRPPRSGRGAATTAPATLLRRGLLDDVDLALAAQEAPFAAFADAVADGCGGLGASVTRVLADPDEDAVRSAVAARPALAGAGVLVCDAAGGLARHAAGGSTLTDGGAALTAALAGVWNAIRAVAVPALLDAGRPGRVIAIAPAPSGSPLADAARAALENLARTLSVEWARHGITTVSVAPGAGSTPEEVAALVAYLASPAGAYYSGCQLDLRGPPPRTG